MGEGGRERGGVEVKRRGRVREGERVMGVRKGKRNGEG